MAFPRRGQVYTFAQICKLELRDSPHLGFDHPHHTLKHVKCQCVIQESHITVEQSLSVPGFASTKWEYIRETHEWIPVFKYVDERPITEFVDMEPEVDHPAIVQGRTLGWWVTLKGFPRQQYYADPANVESTNRVLGL